MKKYGKTYENIAHMKTDFITENEHLLKENNRIADLYSKQPKRTACKCCNQKISSPKAFSSHGINYYICGNCGHVNGEFSETSDFTQDIYGGGMGKHIIQLTQKMIILAGCKKYMLLKRIFCKKCFQMKA